MKLNSENHEKSADEKIASTWPCGKMKPIIDLIKSHALRWPQRLQNKMWVEIGNFQINWNYRSAVKISPEDEEIGGALSRKKSMKFNREDDDDNISSADQICSCCDMLEMTSIFSFFGTVVKTLDTCCYTSGHL